MELKKWTRKSNAEGAVKKALAKVDMHDDIMITGIEAADVGVGDTQAWAVKVFAELAEGAVIANDEFDAFKSALEPLAEVELTLPAKEEQDPKKERRASSGRNSPYRGAKIFVSGGKDATNPFRPKSKSHAAFEFVQSNPGTKFEDLQGFGVRIRTITECLRKGTMRSTTK